MPARALSRPPARIAFGRRLPARDPVVMSVSNHRRIPAPDVGQSGLRGLTARRSAARSPLIRCTSAVALFLAPVLDTAQAQPDEGPGTTAGNLPKTLLEAVLGDAPVEKRNESSGEERRLDPDRPHFPEATTT